MTQILTLINKAERYTPAVYKFGRNERLNIHLEDQYADITDAETGSYIRYIGWDGLREMGYSPAKLLAGDTDDQFIDTDTPAKASQFKSYIRHVAVGLTVGAIIATVGNVTGCNSYVMSQAEKDIATSTINARTDLESPALIEFRKQNQYANKKLAEMKRYASTGGVQ